MRRISYDLLCPAFTLIDLLMGIAIVALLAGLLLPALAAAGEKAGRSACLNNLNHVGNAPESYCGDYSQYFPCTHQYAGAWGQNGPSGAPRPLGRGHAQGRKLDEEVLSLDPGRSGPPPYNDSST